MAFETAIPAYARQSTGVSLNTIPAWNIPGRPVNAKSGIFGFNLETKQLEYWTGSAWLKLPMRKIEEGINTLTPLTLGQENKITKILTVDFDFPVLASLDGIRLNRSYGLIGGEQHLYRYPGDNLSRHADNTDDTAMYGPAGIAPGLGAWGYFAPTKAKLTPALLENEKWYAVVQTLYMPDWSSRLRYLRDWYKYRKVLIVNTINGNAVVADIADSGPAAFTGKHFGGSPEVMNYLGGSRYKKGPVIVFFVDDPENLIPLGPVDYNSMNIPTLALTQI